MEQIALIGMNWRHAGGAGLGACTLPEGAQAEALPRLAEALGARELVYLATCNRVEVAFVTEGSRSLTEARDTLWATLSGDVDGEAHALHSATRIWAGEGAAEHIFLVAAGLDSAVVGETEIAGQLRRALERSQGLGLLGKRLSLVGREALRLAGRIQRDTPLGEGRTSLARIAIERLQERMARTPGAVALVGVSDMTRLVAKHLADAGAPFLVVNRTLARATSLCREVGGGQASSLASFRERPPTAEAIVLAVGGGEPVLRRATLERLAAQSGSGEPPLVIDFGIPPNVAPQDAKAVGCDRIGMDDLNALAERTRRQRLEGAAEARLLVDAALIDLRRQVGAHAIAPMVAALHRRYRHTAEEAVQRLFRKVDGLDSEQREIVQAWAATLAARFAHIPSRGLKALAAEGGTSAVETFFRHADNALLQELRGHLSESAR